MYKRLSSASLNDNSFKRRSYSTICSNRPSVSNLMSTDSVLARYAFKAFSAARSSSLMSGSCLFKNSRLFSASAAFRRMFCNKYSLVTASSTWRISSWSGPSRLAVIMPDCLPRSDAPICCVQSLMVFNRLFLVKVNVSVAVVSTSLM